MLGDQDAGESELAERAAAGTVAGPEADDRRVGGSSRSVP